MSTAILVLSVDEAPLLAHSLPLAAAQPGAELTVIDNACSDGTRAIARAHGARVVALPTRRSYAAAMNEGLRAVLATRPDAVLLLNADCFLHPDLLSPRAAAPGRPLRSARWRRSCCARRARRPTPPPHRGRPRRSTPPA